MKKFIPTALFALSGAAAMADAGDASLDTSALETMLTGLKTDLGSFVSSAIPVLGGIAAVFLLFWLGKVIFRVVKGWANKAG